MAFTKRGLVWSARASLLVVVVACTTVSGRQATTTPSPHGDFAASSECIGSSIGFTLRNLDSNTSILLHDRSFIILDQSLQVIYQPVPGPLVNVGVTSQPPNIARWVWDQKMTNGNKSPVGTYVAVLAVEDDAWDPFADRDTDPWIYVATFKILPSGPQC